jgi:threonine dehydrogenase-like Zn-dependent dehydrogenase
VARAPGKWVPEICPFSSTATRSAPEGFATHTLPLRKGPEAYETVRKKQDGAIKILLQP